MAAVIISTKYVMMCLCLNRFRNLCCCLARRDLLA